MCLKKNSISKTQPKLSKIDEWKTKYKRHTPSGAIEGQKYQKRTKNVQKGTK